MLSVRLTTVRFVEMVRLVSVKAIVKVKAAVISTKNSSMEMNILKTAKFYLRVLGCLPIEPNPFHPNWIKKLPINRIHITLGFILLLKHLFSVLWFWKYEAKTPTDQTQSGFFVFRAVLCLVLYLQLIRQRENLVDLVTSLETMIAASTNIHRERHSFYSFSKRDFRFHFVQFSGFCFNFRTSTFFSLSRNRRKRPPIHSNDHQNY